MSKVDFAKFSKEVADLERDLFKQYPTAREKIASLRRDMKDELPAWEFLPAEVFYSIVNARMQRLNTAWDSFITNVVASGRAISMEEAEAEFRLVHGALPGDNIGNAPLMSALAGWAEGRGIYHFQKNLEAELLGSAIGKIPVPVLNMLPELSPMIYLHNGPMRGRQKCRGFWFQNLTYLNERCLYFNLWFETFNDNMTITLKSSDLETCLSTYEEETIANVRAEESHGLDVDQTILRIKENCSYVRELLPLVLYLCSCNADTEKVEPNKKERRRNLKAFKVEKVYQEIKVGYRIGPTLAHQSSSKRLQPHQGGTVAPHLRRAHWHSYWVGKRDSDERRLVLKWIAPTLVGEGPDVPVFRQVVK